MKRSAISFLSIKNLVFFSILVFSSSSAFCEWHFQESGTTETLNDVDFMDELHGWAVGENSTIIATSDGGETWVKQACPVDSLILNKVEFINNKVGYCLTKGGPLFKTQDGGLTWFEVNTPFIIGWHANDSFFIDEKTGWIIGIDKQTDDYTIYKTKDGGNIWESQYVTKSWFITSIDFIDKNTGWALNGNYIDNFDDTKVIHTIDGGETWNELGIIQGTPTILYAVSADTLWTGYSGFYKSLDGGITWNTVNISEPEKGYIYTRLFYPIDGQQVYVYGAFSISGEVALYYTNNGGKTFSKLLDLPRDFFACKEMIGFRKEHLLLVGYDGKILKYTKDTVSVKKQKNPTPKLIKLFQNTPNPFNASTTIRFSLAKSDHIELAIYDITGRRITVLLSDVLESGFHSVVWDGKTSNNDLYVASGVYLYELSSSTFKERKKMLFVR